MEIAVIVDGRAIAGGPADSAEHGSRDFNGAALPKRGRGAVVRYGTRVKEQPSGVIECCRGVIRIRFILPNDPVSNLHLDRLLS
jgi:hypothetical protein